MKKNIKLLVIACVLSACGSEGVNKFADPQLIKIAGLQDRRLSDSLYVYAEHENPVYRKEAALAFASVQDTLAADRLGKLLLSDTDPEVKKAAAIALGQIRCKASAEILQRALQAEKDPTVLREILEACGKTFHAGDVSKFTVTSTDSLTHEGLAWAYYRLSLRNQADSTLTLKSAEYLKPTYGLQTRLGAANFFTRGAQQAALVEAQLIEAARHDTSPWVRASVTGALRKIQSAASLAALKEILKTDGDYRVRVSAV
ncbi:MAG TPA: HEAT repeat domain-containing protein, partial [Cyclobacteriaceae bacterium]|nr:HEAT repeat domain-containing protein [Cyclobacteriaceae bacterium]